MKSDTHFIIPILYVMYWITTTPSRVSVRAEVGYIVRYVYVYDSSLLSPC